MSNNIWPFRHLHNECGTVIAVCKSAEENARAYRHLPVMTLDEMYARSKEINGYVMQQDDGHTSPFTLRSDRKDES